MEGKGILLHKHSVALVDGEAKSPDPSILRYGEIAINYATDHETISIKNQNDEIATFKTHKLYTQLLGDKQDKTDDTLLTQDKTVVGALNELKTDLDDSVEPYVVNLTNLLSANDSESISAAIGGIENLNSTISKNQVIFGVLATGTVAVGIRVFGNQTTLNYFVDSVLGLTINEIAITNTDNTLSKTVETHAVLTENMVINSLNSDETTLPLSAAQGKALDSKISGSAPYIIDGNILVKESPTSEEIDTAIGGWDNLVAAIQSEKAILLTFKDLSKSYITVYQEYSVSDSLESIILNLCQYQVPAFLLINIGKENDNLQISLSGCELLNTTNKYFDLNTTDKTITGAINELKSDIDNRVGKIDPNSDGTGEIFNDYTNNKATGNFAHAEGSWTTASGRCSHAEGLGTTASGYCSHAEGYITTASGACAHAEGSGTTASGACAHAEGFITKASGYAAHTEGNSTKASGDYAHAEGRKTIASGEAAHAEGQYNFDDPSAIHMVGIGTSDTNRKNAIVVHDDGSVYVMGIGGYQGTTTSGAQSLQEVIASLLSQ